MRTSASRISFASRRHRRSGVQRGAWLACHRIKSTASPGDGGILGGTPLELRCPDVWFSDRPYRKRHGRKVQGQEYVCAHLRLVQASPQVPHPKPSVDDEPWDAPLDGHCHPRTPRRSSPCATTGVLCPLRWSETWTVDGECESGAHNPARRPNSFAADLDATVRCLLGVVVTCVLGSCVFWGARDFYRGRSRCWDRF